MNIKAIGWDIEISKVVSPDEDFMEHRPLGISCAAARQSDEDSARLFYHGMPDAPLKGGMTKEELDIMLRYLSTKAMDGYTIVTWNGNFDWDITAEETGEWEMCSRLALDHVDMMWHFFCVKGYPLGLDAACKGMGMPGKPEGMSGALAPVMWAESEESRRKVLDYVTSDADETLELYERTVRKGSLSWTSKKGRPNFFHHQGKWITVKEAATLSVPDTSWMSSPMPRETFYSWLKE